MKNIFVSACFLGASFVSPVIASDFEISPESQQGAIQIEVEPFPEPQCSVTLTIEYKNSAEKMVSCDPRHQVNRQDMVKFLRQTADMLELIDKNQETDK